MKISPSFQLLIAATAGAAGAAAADAIINGSSSGALKLAGLAIEAGLGRGWSVAAAWAIFAGLGPASAAYFRPLTRRSAFALGFGLAAVLSIIIPRT